MNESDFVFAHLAANGCDWPTFVWACARGIGYQNYFNRFPIDFIPPEVIDPDPSVKAALDKVTQEYERIKALTTEEVAAQASADREEFIKNHEAATRQDADRRDRMERMLARAEKWEPPTLKHTGLKGLMIAQLRAGCNRLFLDAAPGCNLAEFEPAKWHENALKHLATRREELEKSWQHHVQFAAEATAWLRELRQVVTPPPDKDPALRPRDEPANMDPVPPDSAIG